NVTADLAGLVYQPNFNFFGTDTLTVTVTNTATPPLLGPTETATGTVTLNITKIKFAPSFTPGGDVTINDNSSYSALWATNIVGLPPTGNTAGLFFTTTVLSGASLFATAPSITPTGTLSFSTNTGVGGDAQVNVILSAPGAPPVSSDPVSFFIHVINTAAPAVNDEIVHWGTQSASVPKLLAFEAAASESHPDIPFQGISAIDIVFGGKVTINNVPAALTVTGRNPMTGAMRTYTLFNPTPVPTPAGDTGYTLEWRIVGTTLAAADFDEAITLALNGAQVVNPANGKTFTGTFSYSFTVLVGDVNGDGLVTLLDQQAISHSLAVKYSGFANVLMDLDGDGSITMLDYYIANKHLGNRGY
ncbi:MAG TPA: dockerin type I repeat-containing protein, partial [Gemmataceae bacterium]|nr:dockerin type I repeat-containing protein [Gemmataceae bacterium]